VLLCLSVCIIVFTFYTVTVVCACITSSIYPCSANQVGTNLVKIVLRLFVRVTVYTLLAWFFVVTNCLTDLCVYYLLKWVIV
jgi:hypothetical protein